MQSVRSLHDEAMELAQLALMARHTGNVERAAALAREAFGREAQAADLAPAGVDSEPTRSILYRSAAWLALDANLPDEAVRLAERGLRYQVALPYLYITPSGVLPGQSTSMEPLRASLPARLSTGCPSIPSRNESRYVSHYHRYLLTTTATCRRPP